MRIHEGVLVYPMWTRRGLYGYDSSGDGEPKETGLKGMVGTAKGMVLNHLSDVVVAFTFVFPGAFNVTYVVPIVHHLEDDIDSVVMKEWHDASGTSVRKYCFNSPWAFRRRNSQPVDRVIVLPAVPESLGGSPRLRPGQLTQFYDIQEQEAAHVLPRPPFPAHNRRS